MAGPSDLLRFAEEEGEQQYGDSTLSSTFTGAGAYQANNSTAAGSAPPSSSSWPFIQASSHQQPQQYQQQQQQPVRAPLVPPHAPSLERGKACRTCRSRKVKCDGARPVCGACARSARAHNKDSPEALAELEPCLYDDLVTKHHPATAAGGAAGAPLHDLSQLSAHQSASASTSALLGDLPPQPFASQSNLQRKRKGGGAQSRAAMLEAKIAELEHLIKQKEQQQAAVSQTVPQQQQWSLPPIPSTTTTTSSDSATSSPFSALLQATDQHVSQSWPQPSSAIPLDVSTAAMYAASTGAATTTTTTAIPPVPSMSNRFVLDVFFPGWPSSLPSPPLVTRLVDVFLTRAGQMYELFDASRLRASLALPPTHADFPHAALLHTLCASAAKFVSKEDFWRGEERYWRSSGSFADPADYHIAHAKKEIERGVEGGRKMFQLMQAVVLLNFLYYTSGRFMEVWLSCGVGTRLAPPLGLTSLTLPPRSSIPDPTGASSTSTGLGANHTSRTRLNNTSACGFPEADDEAAEGHDPKYNKQAGKPVKNVILPPPRDSSEYYERCMTFWLAVSADRFASASTGWAMSLDEADIMTLLPTRNPFAGGDDPHTHPLSLTNPNLFMSHPPHVCGITQLYFKTIVLLGRVISHLQSHARRPEHTQLSGQPDWRGTTSANLSPDARLRPDFKRIDADVVTFRLSLPRELHALDHVHSDPRLALVHGIPHALTILLHENFITLDDGDVSLARCLLSARAILDVIYALWGTSFDIGLLIPFINWCWVVAGRTFVRELAINMRKGRTHEAEKSRADVGIVLAAMRSYKSQLADNVAMRLQEMLDNPLDLLPSASAGENPVARNSPVPINSDDGGHGGPTYCNTNPDLAGQRPEAFLRQFSSGTFGAATTSPSNTLSSGSPFAGFAATPTTPAATAADDFSSLLYAKEASTPSVFLGDAMRELLEDPLAAEVMNWQ